MLMLSDCLSQLPFSSPASASFSFHRPCCILFHSAPNKCLSLSSLCRWKCHLPFSLTFLLCSFSSPVVIWLNPILAIILFLTISLQMGYFLSFCCLFLHSCGSLSYHDSLSCEALCGNSCLICFCQVHSFVGCTKVGW